MNNIKPFEPGDIVIVRKDILSHTLKNKVCTIRTCYYHITKKEYVVSIKNGSNLYFGNLYCARYFEKYNSRKDRIESLNLD